MANGFKATLAVAALLLANCNNVTSADCTNAGGSCVGVGSCAMGTGHLSSVQCPQSAETVCCLPLAACTGPEHLCCDSTASFRPNCVDGGYVCLSGQTFCDGG